LSYNAAFRCAIAVYEGDAFIGTEATIWRVCDWEIAGARIKGSFKLSGLFVEAKVAFKTRLCEPKILATGVEFKVESLATQCYWYQEPDLFVVDNSLAVDGLAAMKQAWVGTTVPLSLQVS
jgi:hypothetical protein